MHHLTPNSHHAAILIRPTVSPIRRRWRILGHYFPPANRFLVANAWLALRFSLAGQLAPTWPTCLTYGRYIRLFTAEFPFCHRCQGNLFQNQFYSTCRIHAANLVHLAHISSMLTVSVLRRQVRVISSFFMEAYQDVG